MIRIALDWCPMTKECPGYDQEWRVCLVRPADCDVARELGDVGRTAEAPIREGPDRASAVLPCPRESASSMGLPRIRA